MSVLPYQTSACRPPQVVPRCANGERHRVLPSRADLHRSVTILNKAFPNLLGSSRQEAGSATMNGSFPVRLRKQTKSLSKNERRQGDVMKKIRSETYALHIRFVLKPIAPNLCSCSANAVTSPRA